MWGLLKNRTRSVCSFLSPCGYCKDWNEDVCASLLCVRLEINFTELAVNVWCNEYPIPLPKHSSYLQGKCQSRCYVSNALSGSRPWAKKKSTHCLLDLNSLLSKSTARDSFLSARQTDSPQGHQSTVPWLVTPMNYYLIVLQVPLSKNEWSS